ncbi:unnamed protein product [Lathyrus sativus]|nr:unnamed protein product [Lathyrus sativus]
MNQRVSKNKVQQVWNKAMLRQKFKAKDFYAVLNDDHEDVMWKNLMMIATKDRLKRFGMLHDSICSLYNVEDESINHLLFGCSKTKGIWIEVLNWLDMNHSPGSWRNLMAKDGKLLF